MSEKITCRDCDLTMTPVPSAAPDVILLRCQHCGLVRVREFLHVRHLTESWDRGGIYQSSYVAGETWRRKVSISLLNWVHDHVTPPGSILDVGCAAGFFLDEASHRGWECWGIDLSEAFITYVKNHFSDIEAYHGDLYDPRLPEGYFKAIVCCDTLGYTTDPLDVLKRAYRLLSAGGYLFMTNLYANRLIRVRKELLTFNYYFDKSCLQGLLSKAGFHEVECRITAKNLNTAKKFSWPWWRMSLPLLNRQDTKMLFSISNKP